jgi:hypothetical protein
LRFYRHILLRTIGADSAYPTAADCNVTARRSNYVPFSASGYDAAMARFALTRRAGPLGLALTAWDVWRRIPKKQRQQILRQARKHGPTVIKQVRKHGPTVARQLANRRKQP